MKTISKGVVFIISPFLENPSQVNLKHGSIQVAYILTPPLLLLLIQNQSFLERHHIYKYSYLFLSQKTTLHKFVKTYNCYNICIIFQMNLFYNNCIVEMSRNVQSGNTQNLKSMVIQRSFPKWSVAERRKTAAASDQAAVCAHSRYFAGGSPSGLRV